MLFYYPFADMIVITVPGLQLTIPVALTGFEWQVDPSVSKFLSDKITAILAGKRRAMPSSEEGDQTPIVVCKVSVIFNIHNCFNLGMLESC